MLIISSDTEPVYAEHRKVWLSYMNSSPQIDAYFIQYRDGPQELDGNTFWLTGKESFQGIITKTIDSLDYFLKKTDYDFIIRTNLSSVWNFKVLINYLNTLPKCNVYNGFIGRIGDLSFASGSGFIISNDVARFLVNNRIIAEAYPGLDDVAIAATLKTLNITPTLGYRNDTSQYNLSSYHYRVKTKNRLTEAATMMQLLNIIQHV